MVFVQKFNNRLLLCTFICRLVKITNIISMIRQQVPENDVKKITSQEGRRRRMLREIFLYLLMKNMKLIAISQNIIPTPPAPRWLIGFANNRAGVKRDSPPAGDELTQQPWESALIPVTINSMPRAISNRPIIRVMTLIPVCPSKRTSHGAIRKIPSSRADTAIASENPTRCTQVVPGPPDDSLN